MKNQWGEHMLIKDAIQIMKDYCKGIGFDGKPIDDFKTRDKILYGNPNQEITGIVTTCYASVEVIHKAIQLGANFIIVHEALFWNHGDHTDWLKDNKTFQYKKALLDEGNICVWRNHDYIHSGIPLKDGTYTDGIFYGVMEELGWTNYLIGDIHRPVLFEFPETTVHEFGHMLKQKLNLNGVKIIGSLDSPVKKVWIPGHIDGRIDNQILETMEKENIDTLVVLECTDYTVAEYVRDSTMSHLPKTIIALGHFNSEEPGMKYMLKYLPEVLNIDVKMTFIPCTDMFTFVK